ncbi:type II toxin-antitoxin system RelE family toxin [Pleurocapsa sp. FMAR1]|uniref:type II toxin-antitoxin system RelE family toxin n=1 Tax=Pleurocapsa sp. FMAR1 TaxID=3040204 RepID=UPI0029C611AE|nr:type II toxin-antitoxin system RelE/ParE family toxin [Pleurocapsa sp. FMAR1]
MQTDFKNSFLKDIRAIKDKATLNRLEEFINAVEIADSLAQIPNLKKLKGKKNKLHYRSRIGNYRVGLVIKQDIVAFVRFLHRKEIYRYFP